MPFQIKKDKKWGSPAFQDQNFNLKIEGKMAFLGNIYRQCRKKRYWMHLSDEHINGVHLSYFRQVVHVYYQVFDSKMADGDQLWSVPKLEYDLLRRNASTNGQKTDLIERYILHRKPKQTIYVRYFSILLYLLNVQAQGLITIQVNIHW